MKQEGLAERCAGFGVISRVSGYYCFTTVSRVAGLAVVESSAEFRGSFLLIFEKKTTKLDSYQQLINKLTRQSNKITS